MLAGKNFLAGLMFMAFGLLGLWLARDLDTGTAGDMDAGYFPRLVCALLIALGRSLAACRWCAAAEAPRAGSGGRFVFVTLSCLAFALLLRPLGLVLTLPISIVLARFAAGQHPAVPLLLLCLILVVANVGIFVIALKVQIPLWPAL